VIWLVCADEKPLSRSLLRLALSRLTSLQAFALSTLATYDWPDDYPDLLSSGSPDGVHGAMRVISEFVKNDLSEDQLLPVVQDLVPALLAVLGSPQVSAVPHRPSVYPRFRTET
jgi:hypothetical protein